MGVHELAYLAAVGAERAYGQLRKQVQLFGLLFPTENLSGKAVGGKQVAFGVAREGDVFI